jgi:hypothetical protein
MKKMNLLLVLAMITNFGCRSVPIANPVGVCEIPEIQKDPYWQNRDEIFHTAKIQKDERMYIQYSKHKCVIEDENGSSCGLENSINLVWEKNGKVVDKVYLEEPDCDYIVQSQSQTRVWSPNDVRWKNKRVEVEYFWDYRNEPDPPDNCKVELFKLNSQKSKIQKIKTIKCVE